MTVSSAPLEQRPAAGFVSSLVSRQLDSYPDTLPRVGYLALTVLITVALYYELYVGGSVSTLQLADLHMTFTFYVSLLAFGNLIGAFGSLGAGLADRVGRCNLVVVGLLITGVLVAFVIPAATDKWSFGIETFAVGLVEGVCLVATPALVRDFSPQVGRAVAMGFWTMGPVLGSLVVSVVGSHVISSTALPSSWPHVYRIAGIAGLVVWALAFLFLRELSPGLRDQLMVTTRDRALIEARAKGIDIEATLAHPFKQLLKADIVISAFGVSVLLLFYYTAVGFGVIYFTTIFGFTLKQANGLGNWNWGINAITLLVVGVISDLVRVRKPFMIVGGICTAVAIVFYLSAAGHHHGYYGVALLTAAVSFGLGVAYVSWMASFTESVEARNPALTATGLAIWGWILRVVIFASFLLVPVVINTVTPLVNYGSNVAAYSAQYKSELAFAKTHGPLVAWVQSNRSLLDFAQTHPTVIADAQKYAPQLADAVRLAPELAVIQAHPALFQQLATHPTPALEAQAVAAAGGGAKGQAVLASIAKNRAAIQAVIAVGPQLKALAPYASQLAKVSANAGMLKAASANAAQLAALGRVPTSVLAYLNAHGQTVLNASQRSPSQWRDWYWICFGGAIVFLAAIPLLKGRFSPRKAREDEEAHEAMVQAELAKLQQQ